MNKTIIIAGISICAGIFLANTASAATVHYSSARQVVSPQLFSSAIASSTVEDFAFYSISTTTVLSGSSNSTVTDTDAVLDVYDTGSTNTSCLVSFFSGSSQPSFSSSNPSVASIDQSGRVTYVAEGSVTFTAITPRRTKTVNCNLSHTVNQHSTVFKGLVPGSMAAHMVGQVAGLVSGLSPNASTYSIFTSYNDGNHTYTRNPGLYASTTLNLTAIPVNINDMGVGRGILVAPDTIITAWHACVIIPVATFTFADNSNHVYFVNQATTTRVVDSGFSTDICVIHLANDVNSAITPAKVLPPNFFDNKIGKSALYGVVPLLFTNRFATLRIGSIYNAGGSYGSGGGIVFIGGLGSSQLNPNWYSVPVNGDSGNVSVAVINGEAVAVGSWTTANAQHDISSHEPAINAVMAAQGSPYTLTPIDVSAFPTY